MRQIAAFVTMMILIVQGMSSLALAAVSQDEFKSISQPTIVIKPQHKHAMMHNNKHQHSKMRSFKGKKGKMRHFRGKRGKYCSDCLKKHMRETSMVDTSYNFSYNLGLAYIPKAPTIIEKLVPCHHYALSDVRVPKQEYYAPLEKPPKALYLTF